MPLYEYRCRKCARRFEALVMGSEKASCPHCDGRDLEKLVSRFAVAGTGDSSEFGGSAGDDFDSSDLDSGPEEMSGACGSCGDPRGPGSCATDD